jgi:hypothetical protein
MVLPFRSFRLLARNLLAKSRPPKHSSARFINTICKSSGDAAGVALTNAKLVRSYFTVGLASLILEIEPRRQSAASRRY